MEKTQRYIPSAIGVVMLGVALLHMPYGYYQLLRLSIFGLSIYLATNAIYKKWPTWKWIFWGDALIYNPLIPIHFAREVWSWINIATLLCIMGNIIHDFYSESSSGEQMKAKSGSSSKTASTPTTESPANPTSEMLPFPLPTPTSNQTPSAVVSRRRPSKIMPSEMPKTRVGRLGDIED